MSKLIRSLVALGLGALAAGPASADSLPGMRGHDHTGITVPDMNQAVTSFEDVIGCKKAFSFGPFSDDKGNLMKDMLDVNPRAVITQLTMMRCGFGSNIELFSYTSPDQQVVQPKNSDVDGYHIAFYVDDIKAADKYLRSKGVWTMFGPVPINQGPAAGQAVLYFKAPWGLQMEAISSPTAWPMRRAPTSSYGARRIRRNRFGQRIKRRKYPWPESSPNRHMIPACEGLAEASYGGW